MSIKKALSLVGLSVLMAAAWAQEAQAGTCRDPWVDQAIREVTGREPNGSHESGDCNIRNFNNASWNSYLELKRYVRGYFASRPASAPVVAAPTLAPNAVRPSLNTNYNSQLAVSQLNGNKLIGDGGGTLIGDGGGTLRRDAYGNLIGHDGATARSNNNSN